jgi:hypothetical protein
VITEGGWQELLGYQDSVVRWSVVRPSTVPSAIFVTVAHDSISTATTSKTVVGEPLSTHPVQPHAELGQSPRTQNERRTRCDCTFTRRTRLGVGPQRGLCHTLAGPYARGSRHILGSHGSGRIVQPVPRNAASDHQQKQGLATMDTAHDEQEGVGLHADSLLAMVPPTGSS